MEINYIKTVVQSHRLFAFIRWLIGCVKGLVQEFVDEDWVLDSPHFALVHRFNIGGLVLEPTNVIGH